VLGSARASPALGETNAVASILRAPAATRASRKRRLSSVLIGASICSPSRGPTSRMSTAEGSVVQFTSDHPFRFGSMHMGPRPPSVADGLMLILTIHNLVKIAPVDRVRVRPGPAPCGDDQATDLRFPATETTAQCDTNHSAFGYNIDLFCSNRTTVTTLNNNPRAGNPFVLGPDGAQRFMDVMDAMLHDLVLDAGGSGPAAAALAARTGNGERHR